jgi:hypothetical protein
VRVGDRSGRSARPEVAPGLTPDSVQPKYAQMVALTWITPGCVQFLESKKRFHTAWTRTGHQLRRDASPLSHALLASVEREMA